MEAINYTFSKRYTKTKQKSKKYLFKKVYQNKNKKSKKKQKSKKNAHTSHLSEQFFYKKIDFFLLKNITDIITIQHGGDSHYRNYSRTLQKHH